MPRQVEMISLEELVPADHPYRYFKQVLNESFITRCLFGASSDLGREGYGIVRLFYGLLLQFMEDLSDRECERFLKENLSGKWLCGFGIGEITPLVYSLQFSQIRQKGQIQANKSALSKDIAEIFAYVEKYRNSISDDIYSSQEFSIKLIQVPKISNTSRAEAAVEFVKWSELDEEDKAKYDQLAVIVKDKSVKIEAANVGRLKPSKVVESVNKMLVGDSISRNDHSALWRLFSIRPESDADDPFDTNIEFCHYDEAHNDYLYQEAWVEFIAQLMQSNRLTNQQIRDKARFGEKLKIEDYRGV